jgi:glycosyltransferase involved in cell wall biosynthesis
MAVFFCEKGGIDLRRRQRVSSASNKTDTPMRVCILVESYHPRVGGTPSQARMLAADLMTAGHEVVTVTRRWDREHPARDVVDGAEVIRVGPVGRGALKKWGMLLRVLPPLLRLPRIDLIFCPGLRVLGAAAVMAAKIRGCPCVLRPVSCGEMSGAFFSAGLKRAGLGVTAWPVRAGLALRNAILRHAEAFVAISTEIADELARCGVPEKKIARIPNGVDDGVFKPASFDDKSRLRASLGVRMDERLVVYTGRLVTYKGLPGLLRVWERVAKVVPAARLVLVGGGGNDMANCENDLRAFCQSHDLGDRVTFTDDVPTVIPWLQAADAFVFPTQNEAFGISLIEAMACGLPVVSTDVGGVKDIVADGVNSLVFQAGDEPGLEAALLRVMRDPVLAARIGQDALETVKARYTRDRVAKAYLTLFVDQVQQTVNREPLNR